MNGFTITLRFHFKTYVLRYNLLNCLFGLCSTQIRHIVKGCPQCPRRESGVEFDGSKRPVTNLKNRFGLTDKASNSMFTLTSSLESVNTRGQAYKLNLHNSRIDN